MTTRRADQNSPLRQERYASDPAFNEALKASAVARRCRLLADPRHKELCLHIQHLSMRHGGLTPFVTDFLSRYGDRIGSKTMRENRGRKIFNADQVRAVREELREPYRFPLKGETDTLDPWCSEIGKAQMRDDEEYTGTAYEDAERTRQKVVAAKFPDNYAAAELIEYCLDRAEDSLEAWLIDFCLNPEADLNDPPRWFFHLEQSLFDYFDDRRADALAGKVVTSIGEQINDALDYAWDERCMVHINGVARMGKTFQVEQWCGSYPGRVRYVQVPSSNDDISFFRAIARALGSACGSTMKSTQIKRQVEDAIQDAELMLVFDEAHYLWPQQKRSNSYPRRINWVLTELVNKGLPVAIITTPQFDVYQNNVINNSGWAAEQLDGRIAYRLDLPATLPDSDLLAVAKQNLSGSDSMCLEFLCEYAKTSGKYLAAIESVAKRTRFLAKKSGRTEPNETDLLTAVREVDPSVQMGSDSSEQKQPIHKQSAKAKIGACRTSARPMQSAKKELVGAN
jgi:hypothetical protein